MENVSSAMKVTIRSADEAISIIPAMANRTSA